MPRTASNPMTAIFRLALHWQILIGMIAGAVGGLTLNWEFSDEVSTSPDGRVEFHDSTDQIRILYRDEAGEPLRQIDIGLPPADDEKLPNVDDELDVQRHFTLSKLKEHDPKAFALFEAHGRSTARSIADGFNAVGRLFLQMLKMVSIPLIVTSLLTGVLGLGHASRLGTMFSRTLTYYLATSFLAIVTGLAMVNLIRPGMQDQRMQLPEHHAPGNGQDLGAILFEQLQNLIPANPIAALAEGNFLSIIAFSLAFGVFALIAGGKTSEMVGAAARAGFDVMMNMTMAVIRLAPVGVLCLMLYVTATQGLDVFRALAWYVLTVASALAIHAMITLPLIVRFVARRSPWEFFQSMSPALLTAFSSASSNATLPLTLNNVEQRAGVSNRVSSFVLPLGATINMDGTALYEAVAVLFIAQMTPGFDLTFAQQIIIAVTALLASIGAAGIPHAGLVMMVIILQAVQLPTEMQGLILAVDRMLDMCRTSVNVWSDSCGCAVISRFERSSS